MFSGGGLGGRSGADGTDCITYPSAVSNIPVELLELAVPVVVWRKELKVDSGGPGRRRGGLGQRIEIGVHDDFDGECLFSPWVHCKNAPPGGLAGGLPGMAAAVTGTGALAERQVELDADCALVMRAGEGTIIIQSAGGGGYGPPAERSSDELSRDVADGFVSPEAARLHYGLTDSSLA
jgi:N-methylhydantoinase B